MSVEPENERELKKILRTPDAFVLLQFSAEWCGPCRHITPLIRKLIDKTISPPLWVYIDIDAHPDIANTFDVETIPLFIWYRKNREINRLVGADERTFEIKYQSSLEEMD